ncbi:MAG: DegV family protein [Bacteroidales bacterium]|nr:DegV family protein [Bacteroidales bacterium]MCM1416591.1 DegV family protein [bacterium]MCM1422859.1 DegV family protein [bacterium]
MHETFHIISDGACDLDPTLAQEKNITIVPFYVSFDEKRYLKENVDISVRDFYQMMVDRKGVYPKSSMPSIQDYEEAFLPFIKNDTPVICICITTKFSGSMQSALNARALILEKYPHARITVIDSTVDTVLQGQYVLEAAELRDHGASYEDTVARLETIKRTGRIFFTVGNMEYLRHGGRIGKVAALAGGALDIRPIITLKEGEIFPSGLDRGRKRTLKKVMALLLKYLQENHLDIRHCSLSVGYGYDREEGIAFRDQALSALREEGYAIDEIPLYQIGATIAVHTGPYPLGVVIIERGIAKR